MNRSEEVRYLLRLSIEELQERAGDRLLILPDLDTLHEHFADAIADEIEANNRAGKPTRLIVPVGPTGQYPLLTRRIKERNISLKNCWLFFMDEYADVSGRAIPDTHPLSFKGVMKELFFNHIPSELLPRQEQIVFPDEKNLQKIEGMIERVGGIDTCYGGIGVHGHVAFNEPEPGVFRTGPRLVYLNDFTITINAIRSHVGGDLVNFPRKAVTLGMVQIYNARRIRLYCRNDVPDLDWANTVLRLATLGKPGDDFPVTHLTQHRDYKVITDARTAACPAHVL